MKKISSILLLFILYVGFCLGFELKPVSSEDSNKIAKYWVSVINILPFENKKEKYQIADIEKVYYHGQILCKIYNLSPVGHILIVPYREISPVKSFSVTSNFDSKSKGYEFAVLEELKDTIDILEYYKTGDKANIDEALAENFKTWQKKMKINLSELTMVTKKINEVENKMGIQKFILKDAKGNTINTTKASPLIKTKWGQREPYWNKTPKLNGKKCYAGCVAIAFAQILKYYEWPKKGESSHSYYWSKGNKWLNASFSDSYDWDNMPNYTSNYDTTEETNAVSELCYEAGVAVDMEYGDEGSGAYVWDIEYALRHFFRYKDNVNVIYRWNYSYQGFFDALKRQRDLMRPTVLAIYNQDVGHAVIVDGYMSGNMFHINMGWEGSKDAYYNMNKIYIFNFSYPQHAVINIIPDYQKININKTSLFFSKMEGTSNPAPNNFEIKNNSNGVMDYTVTPNKSWINVSKNSGSSKGEWDRIKVTVNILSLVEGTYTGVIEIVSDDAMNSPQNITVKLVVLPPPIYCPLDFSGSKVENESLSYREYINAISWRANPKNLNIEKYRIYLLDGSNKSLVVELDADTFEYWHRDVEGSRSYTYLLKAVNLKNREGTAASLFIK